MKLLLKRSFSALMIAALLVTAVPSTTTQAAAEVIYQSSTKETVTSGATLEKITRFTNDGWLNINVLRVDLSNPYIKVDTISDKESLKSLKNAKVLAEAWNAVAAINGSYFNWLKVGGYADGPVVESGKLITADNEYNRYQDSMAAFAMNNMNEILYNYWKTDITLLSPTGASTVVMQYNKPSKTDYKDFTILDRRYNEYSVGNIYNDIIEMVVDNGKVTEIRSNQPAVQIPQNGYVVVTRQQGSDFINNNFKVGDAVKYSITTNPDWQNLKMAVTGSAMLVKEGTIPDRFSFDVSGRQPKTVIGTSKDGKQLFMVTVDGRQKSSIGMTQKEAAQLMLELGAYNALDLDGGGSTTIVSREPGTKDLEVINSPSDGMPRAIATAVGIFSLAPPSELDGFIIEASDTNMFVNTSRDFTVKAYDRYFNPITVDPSKIQWSVKGIEGRFEGNRFYPRTTGDGKIVATLGNVSSETDIHVLGSPVELNLGERSIKLSPGQSRTFTLNGKSQDGFTAAINSQDVNWSVNSDIGSFDKGVFKAAKGGSGIIDATVGSAHAYIGVSVGYGTETVKDGFEADNGTFQSYPSWVTGSYAISGEQKYAGSASGKLSYDFTRLESSRAAYMVLPNGGLKISTGTTALGLQVYNSHPNANWLRAELTDANGKTQSIDFTKTLEWTSWKQVQASLEGIALPATLKRIYLVQVSPVPDAGAIYLDNLAFLSTTGFPEVDTGSIPPNTEYSDETLLSTEYVKDENSLQFSVLGQSRAPKNLLEKLLLVNYTRKTNNTYDAAAYIGPGQHEYANKLKVPFIDASKGYKSVDLKTSRLIQLDVSQGGLRSSAEGQWQWLLQQLNSFTGDNVFLFMSALPDSFNDSMEAKLFQKVLADYKKKTGKNVWVIGKWSWNTTKMEQGVKYITLSGLDGEGLSPGFLDAAKMIVVTVKGKNITFEFKPIS